MPNAPADPTAASAEAPNEPLASPGRKVRLERDGDVGVLTVADPPLNLFGNRVVAELREAVDALAGLGVRALVVRAEGEHFSAGADVAGFRGRTPADGAAERAGPARARELVMSADLYDAATLERWGVVNRVLPDAELDEAALAFARRLAAGPTAAHGGTKRTVRRVLDDGVRAADAAVAPEAALLFGTEDFSSAVASFLAAGPGRARFAGR